VSADELDYQEAAELDGNSTRIVRRLQRAVTTI
jgi:hypothetical protein